MKIRQLSLILLLSLAFASCAPSAAEPPPSSPQPAPSDEPALTPTEPSLPFRDTPESTEMPSNPPPVEKFVALAKKDLAERLKIGADQITLNKTTGMIWPDAALGCPSPGKVYAQGRVPGYQISLTTGGKEYVYNTDWNGQVILCAKQEADGSIEPVSTAGPEIGVPIK